MYPPELGTKQLNAFLANLRAAGLSEERCSLEEVPAFVQALQARVDIAALRRALVRAGISLCAYCERERRLTPAVESVELDTGMRSVGAFALVCKACKPKALAFDPGG